MQWGSVTVRKQNKKGGIKMKKLILIALLCVGFTTDSVKPLASAMGSFRRVESWHGSKFNENQKENKDCLSFAKFEF